MAALVLGGVACSGTDSGADHGGGGSAPTDTGGSISSGGAVGSGAGTSTSSGGANGGSGGAGGASSGGGGTGGTTAPTDPCDFPSKTTIEVTDTSTLNDALASATPGTKIHLADGTYDGQFSVAPGTNGTQEDPIILCGSRSAILDQGGTSGYTFHLEADYWILSGFTIARGQKCLMLDGANHNRLRDLELRDAGMEILHFRCSSADNTVEDSVIHGSGKADAGSSGFAEGVYIGTNTGVCKATNKDDRSDRNHVLRNDIHDIYSECIDVKEGTFDGEIRGNTFDANQINGANSADSWVDIKGVGYTVADNVGKNTGGTGLLTAGYQTHFHTLDGSGSDNTFSGNTSDAVIATWGIEITNKTTGNIVKCDNHFPAATSGDTNVTCTN